jgi:argininosuccinate lyase
LSKLLRGGRLSSTREDVANFTSSIKDDLLLSEAVININRAHVMMLMEENIINQFTGVALLKALTSLLDTSFSPSSEDIHMAIEETVIQKTGEEIGGNLHIAKSRNDQIATAIRIQLRKHLLNSMNNILELQKSLVETADNHVNTIILEYTHLQPAQPVTFAHYLLSFIDNLERNSQRLLEAYERINFCPLGAGALATTSFKINRNRVAELLGFAEVLENSIDAVGSRDFILETLGVFTILSVTLSRLAEDLIVWSSMDFKIIELPDDFASTSSIMPQKKNPEPLEIIRADASRVLGNFVASASNLKGLPSTYNLDFQQITPNLWNSIGIVDASLFVLSELLPNLKLIDNVSDKALNSFVAATEIANFLTRKYGIPFRTAHKIVGALVNALISDNLTFKDLTPEMIQNVSEKIINRKIKLSTTQIADCIDLHKLVDTHDVKGGPAPTEVKRALMERKKQIAIDQNILYRLNQKLVNAQQAMESKISSYLSSNSSPNVRFKNSNL